MPLILIFVECGIELIPKQIRNHPAVKRNLSDKNYSSQLLDNALHHSAMNKLNNYEKRGRPDISHICLLNALGSPLNKSGNLELYIHTLQNKIFKFNHEIRIARNFNRFKGLMAKLLIDEKIEADGLLLISRLNNSLKSLITSFNKPKIIILSSKGKLIENHQIFFSNDLSKNYIVIIGGFQKSSFSKEIFALSDNLVSFSKYQLDAWVIANKIISYYEFIHNII